MNPSSLDWSIQSTLSSLFPPFEATAPTVLSQLFRTIEERYHGDALQCLLDYLIPAKHILESVQQAACAEYSDVLFLCEGWPLCLRDRVVIQLAPINPLLLRPGDFYLQVEPFGEQSARIVLKSLLVQEDLLAQENLVGFRAQEGPTVEEAPIPETSYPCIFTETWLKEVNEGRHGYRLQRCVLTSDQGIVKVPWTEVVNPEFLDRPKVKIHSAAMTSCSVIMQDNQPPEEEPESQFTANQAPLEIETMILPAKDGVAVSVRLVESGSRLVKVDQGKPVSHSVGKPVGRVSPNTWDSRHNRELEGEYVDLLDFAKDKEVLGLNKAIIPTVPVNFRPAPSPPKRNSVPCGQSSKGAMDKLCIPCSRSKQFPGDFQKGSESKCRHRQSYLAALRNPVSFEKASLMEPLDEAWPGIGEVEPSCEEQGANHGVESLNCSAGRSSTRPVQSCKNFTHQDQNLVQSNMTTKHFDQNVTQPLLLAQFPDILPKSILECKAFSDSRHLYLSEVPRQEPCQMRSSGQKHAKTQHLPKMGLRAFPDHSSHRQEASASKCQGIGRQQMNSFQYGPTSLQYDFTQPTGQRPSLFHHPQNNPKLLQDQNSPMGQWPLYDNKQCGESSVHVLKTSGKSKSKGRSVSSVSDTARECVQVEKLTSRSLSDVYPEIIPMVPAIHAMQSNKCTAFGLASPILDRKKAAKNDTSSPGTGELKSPPLANGLKLQSSLAELPSAAQSQSLSPGYANHLTPLSLVPSIKSLLQLGIIYLPGSRDRVGRAVLEVHGGHTGWARPTLCPLELCRLLLYLHSVPRRAVRDLGLTIVIDSRKSPPPSVLYKALLMVQEQTLHAVHSILLLVDKDQSPRPERKPGLQVDIVTSLKALHKTIEGHQLTSELGGTFPYNHTDWLQFQQKLSLFELDLQGAALLLERAIKNLDSSKKTDMTQDVKSRIQEQKSLMREVLEDARMVTLQREGGAMLARMRKEEFRFAQSEDYRDSMEAVTCLYNQVEEGVHTLVIRSNQSLQRLDHVLILRETEEELNATRMWCKEEEQQWLKDHKLLEETRERLEQRLADLHTVLTQAKEKKEKQLMLIKDVEKKIQGTNYPETDIFHHNTMKFKTNMAAFQLQAEQYKSDLESFISLYHFCEKALSLTKECIHYLEHMEMGSGKAQVSKLKIFEEKLRAFSPWHFEEERTKVRTMHHPGELRVWEEALAQCQFVRQRLEEILLESDENQTSQKPPLKDAGVLRNSEAPLQASSPCKTSASWEDMATGPWEAGAASQAQSTDNNTGSDSETVSCFHLRYMPGGKSRKGGCAPMVVDGLNIAKNCKKEFRADLSSQTQTEETQTHTPFITSSSEKRPSCTLQNKLTESNDSPTRLIAIIDNDAALKNALKTRKFSCKHHSDSDLRTIDLTTGGDKLPWKGTLRHSHSEGSCVSSNLQSTCCPVSVRQKRSTDKPSMLQDDQESIESHQDSLCSSNSSNVQLEWIQMGNRSRPRVSLDDHSPQVSHQEGFCSGVSNPMGGWEEEGGSSAVHPDDTAPDSFRLGPVIPDRMQESSSCSRFTALENDSNALKLQHIMEELLHTEREYVKALCYVMEHYFPELERPDVPQDLRGQRGNIFGNLEKLRDFHQHHFLKELEFCLREPFLVGRCFLRHKESFGLYALYSKNKPCSDNLLIHYGKEFFKQKQQQLGDKMDLSSYLLRPVQRISKYSLLLQDMLGEWDLGSHEGHERAEIQAALEVIQFQLRHGNNLLAMDDIQECDVNLKEQGQLICQDEFLVSFRKKKCYRHIFLFQDLILFSKTKKSEVGNDIYIYKQSFKTSDIGMTHNCGDSGLCFEIWFRRRKLQDTYTLQAASREMKGSWTKDLERILWEQAIHNREVRMQERVFMGIGYKPFMDIKPSEAAICDRAINCALTGQECKPAVSSGMSDSQVRFPAQRPNSTGSTSWTSSGSHSPSSSSSSGRCSMSPVSDLIGLSRRGVSAPGHGRPNSGVLEEYDIEQEKGIQILLVDSSESSGESVSGFSSSSYMCEEHSEISIIGVRKACVQKMENNHQKNKDQPKSFPKLQNQKRDQPLKKIQADNHMRTSTEV